MRASHAPFSSEPPEEESFRFEFSGRPSFFKPDCPLNFVDAQYPVVNRHGFLSACIRCGAWVNATILSRPSNLLAKTSKTLLIFGRASRACPASKAEAVIHRLRRKGTPRKKFATGCCPASAVVQPQPPNPPYGLDSRVNLVQSAGRARKIDKATVHYCPPYCPSYCPCRKPLILMHSSYSFLFRDSRRQ